jgi:predicted extracellular nuclease
MNVLNYFATLIDSGNKSGPNGLDPRGASNSNEFTRQTQKLVTAIKEMNADILGLCELENSFSLTVASNALKYLVGQVNVVMGAGTYDWVNPGQDYIGTDAIACGFMYKPGTVTPYTPSGDTNPVRILETDAFMKPNDSSDNAATFSDNSSKNLPRNRPAVAVTFVNANVGTLSTCITLALNHLKSKGASGLDSNHPDVDIGDGQGFWADTRNKAVIELDNWLVGAGSGGCPDLAIMGDLNSYAKEGSIQTLVTQRSYNNLEQSFVGSDTYSYVFNGQIGTLDYILGNSGFVNRVQGATVWHVNSDEGKCLSKC